MKKVVQFIASDTKKDKTYDTASFRQIQILTKIADNELPTSKELAIEFNVSVRTIQNDIYNKLERYPIKKDSENRYSFEEGFSLNKTTLDNDEMILLQLALSQFSEVRDFDKIQDKLFKKLLITNFTNPYYVKQEDIEDIDIDSTVVESLEIAIEKQYHVMILSSRGDIEVEPYKITAYDGIWYLFAKDEVDQKVKTFMLSRIKEVKIHSHKHKITPQSVEQILDKTHSAWYDDGITFKVKVKVYKEIASYFKQKEFLQSQTIEEELADGSLIVSFCVTHDEDCDNMIKSWLPYIEVLEPLRFRKKIKNELTEYLKRIG